MAQRYWESGAVAARDHIAKLLSVAQSTSEKLGIKQGMVVLVLGVELPGALTELGLNGALPADVSFVGDSSFPAPLVMLVADTVEAVQVASRSAYERTEPAGRFWIAYRKGANRKVAPGEPAPLHRDTLQAALAEAGLDGVTLIALNDTWSAMRVKAV
jgi:hypothetical protein